jgi:hypothetical protein
MCPLVTQTCAEFALLLHSSYALLLVLLLVLVVALLLLLLLVSELLFLLFFFIAIMSSQIPSFYFSQETLSPVLAFSRFLPSLSPSSS